MKLDGLSMAVHYRAAKFARALTRGDGEEGEDVTENARTIRSIPLQVRKRGGDWEVRGEVVLNRKAFEKLNAEQEAAGLPRFANPRNAAAGSLRILDRTSRPPGSSNTLHIFSTSAARRPRRHSGKRLRR